MIQKNLINELYSQLNENPKNKQNLKFIIIIIIKHCF